MPQPLLSLQAGELAGELAGRLVENILQEQMLHVDIALPREPAHAANPTTVGEDLSNADLAVDTMKTPRDAAGEVDAFFLGQAQETLHVLLALRSPFIIELLHATAMEFIANEFQHIARELAGWYVCQ